MEEWSLKGLLGRAIIAVNDGPLKAKLGASIIDPNNGRCLGFKVISGRLPTGLILPFGDLRQINKGVVIIDSADQLISPDEIVRVKELLNAQVKLLNAKVVTESGSYLGRIDDVDVESGSGNLLRISTRPTMIGKSRIPLIIDTDKIVSIAKHKVVVKDAAITETEAQPAAATISG